MFGLIRRISHSVLPRADRPWDDDATSNAPKSHSRKRRLSSTEREDGPKKVRGDTPDVNVKEVTKGVNDVDLNAEQMADEREAAAVPLPDAPDGELDGVDNAAVPEDTGVPPVDDPIPSDDVPTTHDAPSTEVSSDESVPQEKAEIVHVEDVETPSEDEDVEGKGKAKAD
ncbi:hypothetical protein CPB85DRAFT_1441946 [Mucidula mucida]|nr:hypothetical protein CPB85DRAFT_1441946 [Mucidula mucida]